MIYITSAAGESSSELFGLLDLAIFNIMFTAFAILVEVFHAWT